MSCIRVSVKFDFRIALQIFCFQWKTCGHILPLKIIYIELFTLGSSSSELKSEISILHDF